MLVAIIENDVPTQRLITETLTGCGWQVACASSLEAAYTLFDTQQFEVAIIDRVLDDGDGLELLEYLQDAAPHTRSLLLSQRAALSDRIRGLEDGADDYLPKPFALAELKLRTSILLQRKKEPFGTVLRLGPIALWPETGLLQYGTTTKQLRCKEAAVLQCLLRNQNQVVSRDQLIAAVWPSAEMPLYSTVDVYVRRLRVLLGPHHSLVQTIRGFGYLVCEGNN